MISRLIEARSATGLTQVQVAKRLGKPQSWVSRVEGCQTLLDPLALADLAKLYGQPVKKLLPD